MNRKLATTAILVIGIGVLVMALVTACGGTPTATPIPPPTATKAPAAATSAPPTATKAPAAPTSTPPTATKAPAAPTSTPPTATKAPAISTVPPSSGMEYALPFAPGLLILTGDAAAIDKTASQTEQALQKQDLNVTLVQEDKPLDLRDGMSVFTQCTNMIACLARAGDLQVRRYRIDSSTQSPITDIPTTGKVISQAGQTGGENCVFADAIYHAGYPPNPTKGDPWIAGGSPWIAGGSPVIGVANAANDPFWTQWAFMSSIGSSGPAGIALTDPFGARLPEPAKYRGTGVRVGVFDTSPATQTIDVTWMTPKWSLPVFTTQPPQPLANFINSLPTPTQPIADHGLFVAGMVHAVAPDSEIELHQVLDQYGRGDVWTLDSALFGFMAGALQAAKGPAPITGAVINLSLGVHPVTGTTTLLPTTEITSLNTLLQAAQCEGIPVVAASGNDSFQKTPPVNAQIPASFTGVISVAASNISGGRACYSNIGGVAAPGGEVAGGGCTPAPTPTPVFGTNSVIGLAMKPTSSQTGYVYWAGTSFAAPLVSGLAALLVQKENGAGFGKTSGDGAKLVDTVTNKIKNTLSSSGVISVPNALK